MKRWYPVIPPKPFRELTRPQTILLTPILVSENAALSGSRRAFLTIFWLRAIQASLLSASLPGLLAEDSSQMERAAIAVPTMRNMPALSTESTGCSEGAAVASGTVETASCSGPPHLTHCARFGTYAPQAEHFSVLRIQPPFRSTKAAHVDNTYPINIGARSEVESRMPDYAAEVIVILNANIAIRPIGIYGLKVKVTVD